MPSLNCATPAPAVPVTYRMRGADRQRCGKKKTRRAPGEITSKHVAALKVGVVGVFRFLPLEILQSSSTLIGYPADQMKSSQAFCSVCNTARLKALSLQTPHEKHR